MNESLDQANQCINIAKRCIKDGDFDKAKRMLEKSIRIHSTSTAEALLHQLQSSNASDNQNDQQQRSSGGTDSTDPSSPTSTTTTGDGGGGGAADHSTTAAPHYTKDQIESVRKIRKCKDYYEILGLAKDANEEDLKRAYRKLALKFHPDKNKAPGASEAFKAIGNAFAILSNPEKRERYDKYGAEVDDSGSQHYNGSAYQTYHFSRGFEADLSAEEIFNLFFGGAFSSRQMYHQHQGGRQARPRQRQQQADEGGNNYFMIIQLLPLLFLFGMSFFSGLFIRDPIYALTPNSKYMHVRTTGNLRVTYYVKDSFQKDFQGKIRDLEREVEEDYLHNLRNACLREKQYKENLMFRARYYGDESAYNDAMNMRTPNCDQLKSLHP